MYEARRAALASLVWSFSNGSQSRDALMESACMVVEPAAIRLSAEIGLATILGDSEDGLSIQEIAEKTGVDALKFERILRLLVSQGWFRESKPGYFANNRLSSLIKKDQHSYYMSTYMNNNFTKLAGSLSQMITHPDIEFRKSTDPFHTAFQLAWNTDVAFFGAGGWLEQHPDEAFKFGLSMGSIAASDYGIAIDVPWDAIAKGKDGIVDVGGGQGTLCCSLAAKYPEIKKFIVQDLPATRTAAESFIASKGLIGRVEFEEQDFFKPQQRKGKYVFVMQRVLHDWNTEDGAKMLRHIRDVLNEDSCLLIMETIILSGVASAEGQDLAESFSKLDKDVYQAVPAPEFIPADFGDANRLQHHVSVVLTALCNAFERTLPQLQEMIELGGFKIKKIHTTRGWASTSVLEVVPA